MAGNRNLKVLHYSSPTARTCSVREVVIDAGRRAKASCHTRAIILLENENGVIDASYAGVTDNDKIAMLEKAKDLIIRDIYGK